MRSSVGPAFRRHSSDHLIYLKRTSAQVRVDHPSECQCNTPGSSPGGFSCFAMLRLMRPMSWSEVPTARFRTGRRAVLPL